MICSLKTSIKYFFVLNLIACGTQPDRSEVENKMLHTEEFEEAKQAVHEDLIKEEIQFTLLELPAPSEIPYLLMASGAVYDVSIINTLEKADQYRLTQEKVALNLGIYATDVGYLCTYQQLQEALYYLEECRNLSDYIGVTSAFDIELINTSKDHISSTDTLAMVIDKAIRNASETLRTQQRIETSLMLLAGGFIEGLYLSTTLLEKYPEEALTKENVSLIHSHIIRLILEQEPALDNIIEMLHTVEPTDPIIQLIDELKDLQISYQQIAFPKNIQIGDPEYRLTDELLSPITEKVKEIRTEIVS